jgi:uncharacterized protein with von Willebrand factor type A (vWA) domain
VEDGQPYTRELVAFAGALRDRGIETSPDDLIDAGRALTIVDPLDRDQFYHALRATLIDDPRAEPIFEAVFSEFWGGVSAADESDADTPVVENGASGGDGSEGPRSEATGGDTGADPDVGASTDEGANAPERTERRRPTDDGSRPDDPREVAMEMSRQEATSEIDVPTPSDGDELAELSLLVGELGRQLGVLGGFRQRIDTSGEIDLRRSLDAVREPMLNDLPRVDDERERASVRLFVDVSRSMLQNTDQAFLLSFLFECVRQFSDARVFAFDTTATEVTRHFRTTDVGRTVAEMRRARTEWGSGTTIGACLSEILAAEPFVVDRDTVAIVVSDGWDAGDIELLDEQMRHLERRCQRVVWLNPRAVAPEYEPAVTGMETALEHVDHFFGFAALGDLRTVIERLRSTTITAVR